MSNYLDGRFEPGIYLAYIAKNWDALKPDIKNHTLNSIMKADLTKNAACSLASILNQATKDECAAIRDKAGAVRASPNFQNYLKIINSADEEIATSKSGAATKITPTP